YQEFFKMCDCKLTFTEKALRDMAKLAIERGTGARGLRAIIENVMLDVLYEFPEHVGEISEYVVTPELVRHRLFTRGKKTLRKDETRRETA
ncbi:MAG TPA: ATP-dependent Clp protease ATP-binding subunit ClpX, partial [Planctomycetota bacterium]|nr:ATP-dependent Clp protease ATP-binding subunit ClpX [Planctomycetota bacterium]